MEDTVISIFFPTRAKGGRVALTMTAATLLTFTSARLTLIPWRSSIFTNP